MISRAINMRQRKVKNYKEMNGTSSSSESEKELTMDKKDPKSIKEVKMKMMKQTLKLIQMK